MEGNHERKENTAGLIRNTMIILAAAFMILCCSMMTGYADSYTDENGITWDYSAAIWDSNILFINGCDKIPESGELRIPDRIDGKGPAIISAKAFMNNTEIRTVTFPDSITTIQDMAFYGCTGLEEMRCSAGMTMIFPQAFQNCTSLETVSFNDELQCIYHNAFTGCTSLEQLTIPASVTTLESNAFRQCTSLTAFNVESGNSQYSSKDGVLLGNGGKDLMIYPSGRQDGTFYVPEGVEKICSASFADTSVKHVVLPSTLTAIESEAFSSTSLEDIYIPESVTEISGTAFNGVGSSFTIYAPSGSAAADYAEGYFYSTVESSLESYENYIAGGEEPGTGTGGEDLGDEPGPGIGNDDPATNTGDNGGDSGTATSKQSPVSTVKTKTVKKIVLKRPVLKAKNLKGGKVKLTWSKVKGADGYKLYIKGPKDKKYRLRQTKSARVKSITHKGLIRGKKYKYKIVAYKIYKGKEYRSVFSKVKKVRIKK